MNTNQMHWVSDATGTALSIVNQIESWPAGVILVVMLLILIMTLRALKPFPNRFVPVAIMSFGGVSNLLLGDPGKVHPTQRYPDVILCMQGIVIAFAACLVYSLLLKRYESKLSIFKANGDTTFTENPERQLSRPDIGLDQPDKNKPKE